MQTTWKESTRFEPEMRESKIHLPWARQVQSKEVSHFTRVWWVCCARAEGGLDCDFCSFTSLSEKDSPLDYCQIFIDITMATIDMKTNISQDTSASDDLTFFTAVVIAIVYISKDSPAWIWSHFLLFWEDKCWSSPCWYGMSQWPLQRSGSTTLPSYLWVGGGRGTLLASPGLVQEWGLGAF